MGYDQYTSMGYDPDYYLDKNSLSRSCVGELAEHQLKTIYFPGRGYEIPKVTNDHTLPVGEDTSGAGGGAGGGDAGGGGDPVESQPGGGDAGGGGGGGDAGGGDPVDSQPSNIFEILRDNLTSHIERLQMVVNDKDHNFSRVVHDQMNYIDKQINFNNSRSFIEAKRYQELDYKTKYNKQMLVFLKHITYLTAVIQVCIALVIVDFLPWYVGMAAITVASAIALATIIASMYKTAHRRPYSWNHYYWSLRFNHNENS
jgi:hypothetical protein